MPMGRSGVEIDDDSAWHKIFEASVDMPSKKPPLKIIVGCNPDSDGTRIKVRVEPLHDNATDAPVYKGGEQPFEFAGGIREVYVQAVGGDCIVDWSVIKSE